LRLDTSPKVTVNRSLALARWQTRVAVPAAVAVAAIIAVPLVVDTGHASLRLTGLRENGIYDGPSLAAMVVTVTATGTKIDRVRAQIDGHRVPTAVHGRTLTLRPGTLRDGTHTLDVNAPGHGLRRGASVRRTFSVDTTPPALAVDAPKSAPSLRSPVTITGKVTGAVRVTAGTKTVSVRADRFTLTLATPPAGLKVVATDIAGNATTDTVTVPVHHPLMRGVHLTGYGWNFKPLRNPVLRLAREHKINTVELDIKEEDGYVNFDTSVQLAHRIHAVRVLYDPRKVINQLHAMNVRVVGRIVCFRDPKLATWAWHHGHHSWDVQSPGGGPYKSANYGGAAFTNWADPAVRKYNIALAVEGAKLGFDDVMFDYVRRPDGPLHTMRFPGATVKAPQGVTDFVKEASAPIRDHGAYLGLAVFGVSATRPKEVGQNIGDMAKWADYVAPMVYPSHWGPGEYGVSNPNAQPYAIVHRSLKDFQKKVAGTTAEVIPWLQDFSLGVTYNVPQVVAQIRAAAADNIESFLLWDAGCVYQAGALTPMPS
jgi:hypothetical protein